MDIVDYTMGGGLPMVMLPQLAVMAVEVILIVVGHLLQVAQVPVLHPLLRNHAIYATDSENAGLAMEKELI